MPEYRTPNVYVEEISTLPPSVSPVATAIPAFIGYTEKSGEKNAYLNKPIRIRSIVDYTTHFGGAHPTEFTVTVKKVDKDEQSIEIKPALNSVSGTPKYLMYYMLRLYFDNGGGPCYVVSIGDYNSGSLDKKSFDNGLKAIKKEDEPTLILLTDAVNLSSNDEYYNLCQQALEQCNILQDRFAIFDVLASDRNNNSIGSGFRTGIGTDYLKYGAAYYPYLQTSLNYHYTHDSVTVNGSDSSSAGIEKDSYYTDISGLRVIYAPPENLEPSPPKVKIAFNGESAPSFKVDTETLTITLPNSGATVADIVAKWDEEKKKEAENNKDKKEDEQTQNYQKFDLRPSPSSIPRTITSSIPTTEISLEKKKPLDSQPLENHKTEQTDLFNQVKAELNKWRVVLPPSAAVAGVYARVDRDRGVWKAPANVSLAGVIGPKVKINNEEQEDLNKPTNGKSINAIRSFSGKGTLIWGARTLAGNDNEWKYIPVRRLFNLIEESIQKATAFAVFESNNAITWLKLKTMIENYLDGLWRQGALAGPAPEAAFFVNIGLGKSMTQQDILNGRMIIEVGIAAVRPAEFIILKFSHKLQEA